MGEGTTTMETGLIILAIIAGGKIVANTITKTIKAIVKSDKRSLELANETFKGNDLIRKEIEELASGNMNPGIGTKNIAKNIFEARSRNGARVYFRNTDEGVEILEYPNKSDQQEVINRILELYSK